MSEDKRIRQSQNKAARQFKNEIDEAVRALLSVPRGRKYLWYLLTIGKVGSQPFNGNALHTSFACGELNVGQQILAHILEVDPAGYVRMMQEQADERTAADNSRPDPDSDPDAGADTDT